MELRPDRRRILRGESSAPGVRHGHGHAGESGRVCRRPRRAELGGLVGAGCHRQRNSGVGGRPRAHLRRTRARNWPASPWCVAGRGFTVTGRLPDRMACPTLPDGCRLILARRRRRADLVEYQAGGPGPGRGELAAVRHRSPHPSSVSRDPPPGATRITPCDDRERSWHQRARQPPRWSWSIARSCL